MSHPEQISDIEGSFLSDLKNQEPAPRSLVALECARIRGQNSPDKSGLKTLPRGIPGELSKSSPSGIPEGAVSIHGAAEFSRPPSRGSNMGAKKWRNC